MNFVVVNNPNKDKSVKETPVLNYISKFLRDKVTFKNIVETEGFELHFQDFIWEWIVDTKCGKRFVFQEHKEGKKTTLQVFFYNKKDNIQHTEIILAKDASANDFTALVCLNKIILKFK